MIRVLRLLTTRALFCVAILGQFAGCATPQGAVRDGEYTSPNSLFSVRLPKPSNWAGVPYTITNLNTTRDSQYDKVMFHVEDFGTYLVAGTGLAPANSVALMDKDDPRAVLRNLSQATLIGWRRDLGALPVVAQESFVESQYGEAIVRVYLAQKGSFLARAQGRRPTRDDAFDTNIASIVARQGPVIVHVLAQNDSSPDASTVTSMAIEFFRSMKVLAVR